MQSSEIVVKSSTLPEGVTNYVGIWKVSEHPFSVLFTLSSVQIGAAQRKGVQCKADTSWPFQKRAETALAGGLPAWTMDHPCASHRTVRCFSRLFERSPYQPGTRYFAEGLKVSIIDRATLDTREMKEFERLKVDLKDAKELLTATIGAVSWFKSTALRLEYPHK